METGEVDELLNKANQTSNGILQNQPQTKQHAKPEMQ
jgi:hypothetical protein